MLVMGRAELRWDVQGLWRKLGDPLLDRRFLHRAGVLGHRGRPPPNFCSVLASHDRCGPIV